jgi:peptidoglycan-associated lipoprotein
MSLKKLATVVLIGSFTVGLVGCGAKDGKARNPYDESSDNIKSTTSFYGDNISSEGELGMLNKKTIYFAYDSSELTPNDMKVLNAHAKYMQGNGKFGMRVAGHTDERGSREYNIALGERRAKAVARYLETQGVPASRLSVVSYGKEQPVDTGSHEQAWAQNRRSALEYTGND